MDVETIEWFQKIQEEIKELKDFVGFKKPDAPKASSKAAPAPAPVDTDAMKSLAEDKGAGTSSKA